MDDRGYPDPDLGHAEFGVVGGNTEVAGGGEFEATTKAPARHSRDHRPRKGPHRLTEIAQAGDEFLGRCLIEPNHFLDVGAADHALLALARYHQRANLPIGRKSLEAFADAIDDGRSKDVQGTGVADRQANDPARVAVDSTIVIEHLHRRSRAL